MGLGLNDAAQVEISNGNGDVPTTVLAAVWKLTNIHGLWALLACTLVWVIIWQALPAIAKGNEDHAVIKNYLQALCLNAAETDVQISRCSAALFLSDHR